MDVRSTLLNFESGDQALPDCLGNRIEGLEALIRELPQIRKGARTATDELKAHLDPWFISNNWTRKFPIDHAFPRADLPSSNYDLDWLLAFECSHHNERHAIALEYAFDNRQAIGTNLLKLETAANRFAKDENRLHLGVVLTATKTALKNGGWDNGIASSEEYENAVLHCYDQVLKRSIMVMSIKA